MAKTLASYSADHQTRGVDFDAPDYGYKEEDKPAVKVLKVIHFLRYIAFSELLLTSEPETK
jgi:hypothetical protein